MTVPILCVVCVFFVAWVIVLKAEIDSLKKENDRMKGLLANKLQVLDKHVEVGKGMRLKGDQLKGSGPQGLR